jgi:hypothetical protein
MNLDKQKLEQIFNEAVAREAEKNDPSKPTLKNLWAIVANKFTQGGFKVHATSNEVSISGLNHSIQLSDNENGTFCINYDNHENFNKSSPEEAIKALGKFYSNGGM